MARDLIQYFETPVGSNPTVKQAQVVEILAKSQKSQKGLTKFEMVGAPKESIRASRRYVQYEFIATICLGKLEGDKCLRPDDGSEIEFVTRRHSITVTAVNEGTAKQPAIFLWLLDISGPSQAWDSLKELTTDMGKSFELGSPTQLDEERANYVKSLQKALEDIKKRDAEEAAKAKAKEAA
mmetsp:Transcript_68560/g.149181  ORF Transcript_68560/g.149181 Transcript_68560/m.149181 type:complete len:181 (-) Transcript_68560:86-628(-)